MEGNIILIFSIMFGYNLDFARSASISKPCEPPVIENGIVKTSAPESGLYNVGKRIRIRCNSGYDIHGNNIPTCLSDGTWTPLPTCVKRGSTKVVERTNSKTCQNPFDAENGATPSPKKDYYNPGDVISLTCDAGYVPSIRDASYTCDKDGNFLGEIATCIPLSCSFLSVPDNLVIENYRAKYFYKETVKYSCEWGYEPDSSSTSSTCENNGRMSPKPPKCNKIYCKKPKVSEGILFYPVADKYEVAEFVAVKCGNGYFMKDNVVVLTCTESGKFSGEFPTCSGSGSLQRGVACNFPKEPANGQIVQNSKIYYEGDIIRYECEDGYEIEGSETSKCQSDGEFFPKVPLCKGISCSPPPGVKNGYYKLDNSDHSHGTVAEYFCNDGYQVDGNKFLTCENSGEYSPSPPTCEKITSCYPARVPRNGALSPELVENPIGQKITFSCNSGFALVGESEAYCMKNGQFYPDSPTCIAEDTCTDPVIENGSAFHGRTVGDVGKIMYSCEEGFEMIGPKSSTCVDGKYDPSPPSCLPIICDPPSNLPRDVEIITEHTVHTVGDKIEYVCPHGYKIIGESTAICEDNGYFSSIPDDCEVDKPSCRDRCYFVKDAECQCDYYCSFYGNCCEDQREYCDSYEL